MLPLIECFVQEALPMPGSVFCLLSYKKIIIKISSKSGFHYLAPFKNSSCSRRASGEEDTSEALLRIILQMIIIKNGQREFLRKILFRKTSGKAVPSEGVRNGFFMPENLLI